MKTKSTLLLFVVLFTITLIEFDLKAQDSIVRINGDFVYGKVSEVGTNAISYKKSGMEDGPVYTEELKNIAYIRYKNGQKEWYGKLNIPAKTTATTPINTNNTKLPGALAGSTTQPEIKTPETTMPENPMLKNGPVSNQYRIEYLDKKFKVNGEKMSSNAVDKLLSRSTNPQVVAFAKSAKLLKTFTKVSKITSYPSTIGGGVASIATFSRMYEQIQDGGASFASCKDFGLSFLGTMALPITSKFLKNRRDKLYDKAIDLYNIAN